MTVKRYTIVWTPGMSDGETRLDFVEAEQDLNSVVVEAAKIAIEETCYEEGETPPSPEAYVDGSSIHAVFDGHVTDTQDFATSW